MLRDSLSRWYQLSRTQQYMDHRISKTRTDVDASFHVNVDAEAMAAIPRDEHGNFIAAQCLFGAPHMPPSAAPTTHLCARLPYIILDHKDDE